MGVRTLSTPHGDVLNRHDGTETAQPLIAEVRALAPTGARVTVSGRPATMSGRAPARCRSPHAGMNSRPGRAAAAPMRLTL
jgi:hypothetical protein